MQNTSLAPKKMNWHMILIYGLLWLMAFMNLMNGLIGVFGVQVAPTADGGMGIALHVYPDMAHPRLFILDGVFSLIMSMYTVFVRFQLSGFKRRGPMFLTVMFGLNIAESVVYAVILYQLIPELAEMAGTLGQTLSVTLSATVAAILSHIYYLRRSELFVN